MVWLRSMAESLWDILGVLCALAIFAVLAVPLGNWFWAWLSAGNATAVAVVALIAIAVAVMRKKE